MGIDISADRRVQIFTTDGAFLFSFGEFGIAPGQLWTPIGLDLDTDGNVLVVDTGNARVQKFSPEGELLAVFDNVGLSNPQVISATADGGFYLSDPRHARVVAFDAQGEQIAVFPRFIVYGGPHGTATGLDGAVYLAETGNNIVRKFVPAARAEPN